MTEKINQLITEQLGEFPKEWQADPLVSIAEAAWAEPLRKKLWEKEIQSRKLLAALIYSHYEYGKNLKYYTMGYPALEYMSQIEAESLIESALFMSWPGIVKYLEEE